MQNPCATTKSFALKVAMRSVATAHKSRTHHDNSVWNTQLGFCDNRSAFSIFSKRFYPHGSNFDFNTSLFALN